MKTFILFILILVGINLGCQRLNQNASESDANGIPQATHLGGVDHSEDFMRSGLMHGAAFQANPEKCLDCHSLEKMPVDKKRSQANGDSISKRSCLTCHPSYPHSEDFIEPKRHGTAYFQSPNSCLVCHKNDESTARGKAKADACTDCHIFPHPSGWSVPSRHGKAVLEGGRENCQSCHFQKSSFQERHPEHFISCRQCHWTHLEPGEINPSPAGLNIHIYEARQASHTCTVCHVNGRHMRPLGPGLCVSCHCDKTDEKTGECLLPSQIKIQWRDGALELSPPKQTIKPQSIPKRYSEYEKSN